MEEITRIFFGKRPRMEENQNANKQAKLEKKTEEASQENASMEVSNRDPEAGFEMCPAKEMFEKVGATDVFSSFEEALQSGDIEEFSKKLESKAFSGILVMLCAIYHQDEEHDLLLEVLKRYLIGSRCDIVGFTEQYGLGVAHQITLQYAVIGMLYTFTELDEIDELAFQVAEGIANAYESEILHGAILFSLALLFQSQNMHTRKMVLAIVTALANLCKEGTRIRLSTLIHKFQILHFMFNMDISKLPEDLQMRAKLCSEALQAVPNPSESSIADSGIATLLGNMKVQ